MWVWHQGRDSAPLVFQASCFSTEIPLGEFLVDLARSPALRRTKMFVLLGILHPSIFSYLLIPLSRTYRIFNSGSRT